MMVELTDQQRQAVLEQAGEPVEVVDPHTQRVYILLPREQYERMYSLAEREPQPSHHGAEVTPGVLRSQKAFWRDLTDLLSQPKLRGLGVLSRR